MNRLLGRADASRPPAREEGGREPTLRIAYVCHNDAFAMDGVNRKVTAQVSLWSEAGHDAQLLVLSPAPHAPRAPLVHGRVFAFSGIADRARATLALARAVRRLRPDVVYLRHHKFLPPLTPLLWPLPLVVEVNSDDRAELAVRTGPGWLYNELERRVTLRQAAGLAAVTHELARADGFARFAKPVIVVANGVDSRLIAPVPAPRNNDRPRGVLLAGAVGVWTGVDRAVGLARAAPELELHLVGRGVAEGLRPLPSNVYEHGLLAPAGYRRLLADADFGLGPLALDRLGLTEASPLKVREYLLHGLPVLTAHEDTDFLGEQPWFLLRVGSLEHGWAPHLARIRAWLAEIRGRRVPRKDVGSRLGLERKEADRLDFVGRVVDASRCTRVPGRRGELQDRDVTPPGVGRER